MVAGDPSGQMRGRESTKHHEKNNSIKKSYMQRQSTMSPENIRELIERSFPEGCVIQNPGGGTTTIVGYNDKKLSYKRGKSRMYLPYQAIISVFEKFKGQTVTTKDLKEIFPEIFDSNTRPAGHSCNCTTLFMLLEGIGLAGPIEGSGKSGSPFKVSLTA